MDDIVGDTLRKLSDQISSFVGSATSNLDETKIRDAVSRAVEDVTFMIDPEKAASFGQKIREFFGEPSAPPREPVRDEDTELGDGDVWYEVTDRPDRRE
jgi:hypothetical protein